MVTSRFIRIFQLFFMLYVSIAVLYTTTFLLVSMYSAFAIMLSRPTQAIWPLFEYIPSGHALPKQRGHFGALQISNSEPFSAQYPGGHRMGWLSSEISLQHGLGHSEPVYMDEEIFLSKAFAGSMRPSKILPYFYRASGQFDHSDITIATLITSNRFQVFKHLVQRYKGPISVTIHVRNTTAHIEDLLQSLHAMYMSSELMATYVDVHLVIDSFDRQFNTWRNIARLFARTDFILMLDIDFAICTDFRSSIRKNKRVKEQLRDGYSAFVIPAFEYVKYNEGVDQARFPKDKRTLLTLVKSKRIGMFHAPWAPGHNSTDYKRYYAARPGEIYNVASYQSAYEPYVVFKKDGPPWCDERFVGYGGNKAACLFEMYLSGVSYRVLADHFIIHQNHLYEETARKNERRYNRKIYSEFKEELCFRYLKSYHENRLLNTTRGVNIDQECKRLKNLPPRIAAEIFKPL